MVIICLCWKEIHIASKYLNQSDSKVYEIKKKDVPKTSTIAFELDFQRS